VIAIGQRIGRYPVEALIGSGGFATVYRARDDRLDDLVAVKVLAENHSIDPDMRERFIAEGCVLRRAADQNLVTVHDLGETDGGRPFLVLEYADRGDLGRRMAALRRSGYRPVDADVRALVTAVGAAVEALHRLSVVHRDLNPGNLLIRSRPPGPTPEGTSAVLGDDERLLLADLGLCKDLARHSGITVGGGTDGFCPPEQRRGPCTVDARADLWALSALVVWLYTGRPPDAAGAWRATMVAAGAPAALADVLDGGLAEDPDDRPASVTQWKEAILTLLDRPAAGSSAPSAPSRRTGPPLAKRAVVMAGGLVLLVAAMALGTALGIRWAQDRAGGATATSTAGAGNFRAAARRGATSVTIVGPGTIAVQGVARFRAEVAGASSWVWLAPDGTAHPNAPELDVTAVTPGEALVHLLAVSADGRTTRATFRLIVKPSPG